MKATDLRIGNYISAYGKYGKIVSINANQNPVHISYYVTGDERRHSCFLSDTNPVNGIPLTADLLVKCGFREALENAGKLPCFKKGDYTIARWIECKWQMWYKTIDFRRSPQTLHALQNRWWVETGTELNIEL